MFKSLKITNYIGESIEFSYSKPENEGFYVERIEGIGGTTATINSTEMSTNDGNVFNSARAEPRNIVLTLGFFKKPTIERSRHLTYKYFPVTRKVTLTFENDERTTAIDGYVESNEIDMFSERQTAQISIVCPNPFFYSLSNQVTDFVGVEPRFTFPFSNNSLTDKLLIMGEIWPQETRSIVYNGEAETGVVITINFAGPVIEDIIIFEVDTDLQMVISADKIVSITGAALDLGDRIVISTVRGDKYIRLYREDREYNILNALNRDAYWFQLKKGDNVFAYSTEYGLANLNFSISNKVLYQGV